jgi:hypothetical protein
LAVLSVLVLTSSLRPASRLEFWHVDSLMKVFADDPVGKHLITDLEFLAARNAQTSLQVALRSVNGVRGLRVEARVPGLETRVRRVGFVPVGSNPKETPPDEVLRRAPGQFPDPLYESYPFDLPAQKTMSVWISIFAPAGAEPGLHKGKLTFYAAEAPLAKSSFTVRVMKATVPARQTLKVTNWFDLDEASLDRHFGVKGNPDRYWEVLGNIGRVMADHRQNVLITPVFSLVQPSIVGDAIAYDYSKLDRWVQTFERAGLIGTIEGGHLLGRISGYDTPLTVPAYVIEDGKIESKKLEPDDPRAEKFLDSFLSALWRHLKEKGWTERYIQRIHDEPHGKETPIYERYARIIRRNLPGIPTIDAVGLDQDIRFFADVCDIWVPVLGSFDQQLDKIRTHVNKGGEAWYYTCIFPQGRHLNRFIDYSLLKVRLLHWFNFRHEFTGFLHWGGNYWDPKPFENVQPIINDGTTLLPAGDNAIVYPYPEKNTILSSIRLETMREGIEDYELLVALAKNDKAKADELARSAIPHIDDYIRDIATFRKLRRRLLESF